MLHVAVHAVVKCGLFLTAGVFVYYFNYTRVEELVGIRKRMPKMLWCYLLLSLALVGIPPTGASSASGIWHRGHCSRIWEYSRGWGLSCCWLVRC